MKASVLGEQVGRQAAGLFRWCCLALAPFAAAFSLGQGALAQMMMLPGQFDVSPTGSALYTVPIEVPPGTAGMSPALTLDYNSDGGNGLLGVGWSLGGLPSIGRCPKTVAQDGARGSVKFDMDDRFCLDGERLMVVSGAYGAANSEYRTEIEGFTKVVAYGTAGNGPQYFRAWTKAGQILEFGNTTDSRILASGTATARAWAVNKISDTKGNYLAVTYTNDAANGQAYPTRIDYTGNAGASLTPYNSVRFEYETRPDVTPLYIAGSTMKNTVRLKRVKTYEGASTVVRVYELAYDVGPATQKSHVTSIKLCDGTGTNCLPATTFSMTNASLSFPQSSTNPVATGDMGSALALYLGDWNGDGITDAMTWNPSTGANKWFVNNGALSFSVYTNPIAASQLTGANSQLRLGDWNGDGVTDIMWWNQSNGTNRWFTNNGALSFTQANNPIAQSHMTGGEIHFGDWNGDGIADVMWRLEGHNRWHINDGALSFSTTINPITLLRHWQEWAYGGTELITMYQSPVLAFQDWNGDGLVDVLAYYEATEFGPGEECEWLINTTDLQFTLAASNFCVPVTNTMFGGYSVYGDWNGDGIADIFYWTPSSGTNVWYVNDGALNFELTINPIAHATISGSIINVGDWNGDGIDDVMFHWPSSGTNRWFTTSWNSSGQLGFSYTADLLTPSQVSGTGGVISFGDWNGDGFADPMWRLASNGSNRWYRQNGLTAQDRLASTTTGLGSTSSFTYKPLTDSGVYTKDATATYPVIDVKAPFYVVSRVDADNGIGGQYSSTYAYVGAKIDVAGRGFLGFRQQIATDLQTSVAQTLTFRQDYPFIGFVSEDKKVRSGVTLNKRTNTYAATNLGGTRRLPVLSQAVEESKDLNGASFPTVTSSYTYDAWGNPLTVTVSTPDGATRTTTNTYSNNATSWILGRLQSATVASTTPDSPPAPTGCQTNCAGDIVAFSINGASAIAGSPVVFTVTKAGPAAQAYNVNYATRDDTAAAGVHYTAASGTLSFATGETMKTISVSTIGGSVSGADRIFHVDLSSATGGATISQASAAGAVSAVPEVSFSIGAASVNEGGTLSFTVTKTGTTSLTHAVNYATANGTGVAGTHYTAKSGSVSFSPSETSKTITVTTLNDGVYNTNRTVLVNLSNPTNGATITTAQGTGTIVNIQAAPTISIGNASVNAGGTLSFTVTKSGATALTHAANYATANGTAVAGTHYTAKSGSVSFAAGETSKTVTVATTAGSVPSGSRAMYVNLTSPTNGATIGTSQGTGTINAPPNNPPVAVNDSVNGYYPIWTTVPVYVLANDSDPDNDPLTITNAQCLSSGCLVQIVGGSYLQITGTTPVVKTVRYWISDGRGGAADATATVSEFYDPDPDCGEYWC